MKPKAPPSKLPQCSTLSRRARDLDSLKVENEPDTQSTFSRLFTSKECEQITNNGERLWANQCDTWSVVELGWEVSPSYMRNGRLWTKILDVASSYWTDDPESPGAKAIELSKRHKIQRMRMTNWIIQSASKTSPLDELGLSGPKFFGSHSTLADGLDGDTIPSPPEDDEWVQSNVKTFSEKVVVTPSRSNSNPAIQYWNNWNKSVYNMKQPSRGKCVICSNETFIAAVEANGNQRLPLSTRRGTEIDVEALSSLFLQLYFKVVVQRNVSVHEMRTLLRAESQDPEQFSVECFVLCILSHGTSEGVYGTDGKILKVEEITTMFGTQNCPSLAGKPKLIFIQACRGERIMREHEKGPNLLHFSHHETTVIDSFKATTSAEGFNMTTVMDSYSIATTLDGFKGTITCNGTGGTTILNNTIGTAHGFHVTTTLDAERVTVPNPVLSPLLLEPDRFVACEINGEGNPACKGRLGRDVVRESTVHYVRREMDPKVSLPLQVQQSMFVVNTSQPENIDREDITAWTVQIPHRTIAHDGGTGTDPSGVHLQSQVEADMLVAYSTQPGYVSYRDERQGTWFIQDVVDVISRNAHEMEIGDMLDVVKGQVATKVTRAEDGDPGGAMQVPDISNSLTKKLYLFPGLIDDS